MIQVFQIDNFHKHALTVAQLIQTNFCKNKNHDVQKSCKILRKKETSVVLYSALKTYGAFRSKTVIDNFFNLGLIYHMIVFLNLQKKNI